MRIGKGKWGKDYQQLLSKEIEPERASELGWKFVNQLTVQGLLAQMNHNKALMQETATIAANYLRSMAKYIERMPIVEGLEDCAKEPVYIGAF